MNYILAVKNNQNGLVEEVEITCKQYALFRTRRKLKRDTVE
jgi:hypothetical protein